MRNLLLALVLTLPAQSQDPLQWGGLFGNSWTGGLKMNHNVYFDVRGADLWPAGKSWSDWQASGMDTESVVADPLFVNAGAFDFRLRLESPALRSGIKQIDITGVGTRGRPGPEL